MREVVDAKAVRDELDPARRRTPRLKEEVDAVMWREVLVGVSERRVMDAMSDVGVERACVTRRGSRRQRRREEDDDEWLPAR
jgi:hypothetical protein